MTALAVAGLLAEGNPIEKLLTPEPGLWLWTLGIFVVMMIFLWKFGWGMMIRNLDRRDQAIRGAVEQAKRERLEAEKLLAEAKETVAKARRDAAEAVTGAQADATKERQKIIDTAREEYEKTVARGREQIEQETKAALTQVRRTVADLAVDVAGKLLQRAMNDTTSRELAEKFAAELESTGKRPQA